MTTLKNDRFLRAARREPVDMTPIWIMRQAGRYLPEYQRTRQAAGGFMALCKTPAFAAEVTLQPLRRYDLDAGIIFSDILTIPDAMGLALDVLEGENLLDREEELILLRSNKADLASLKVGLELDVLSKMPTVLISQHNAYNTAEALQRIRQTTLENIQSHIANRELNLVKDNG